MTEAVTAAPLGTLPQPAWIKPVSGGGRALLDLMLRNGGAVQAELPGQLGLSQPSAARLVGAFTQDGMIRIVPRPATGRGNPSVGLKLEPDFAYGLGVGIFGDALSMALVDFTGCVRAEERVPMPDTSRGAVLERLAEMKKTLIKQAGIDPARIVGAGIGFSGFFVDSPLRFNPPAALSDWVDADVPALLTPVLELPILCDNDATCGAIAESLLGVGRDCANFAYCHLTNGFGGGIIADGRVVRGALGNAGDFGGVWWLLDQGYPNLDLLWRNVVEAGARFASMEEMLHLLQPGTPGIEDWLTACERPFASLAFLLGHMLAPEKIVIGGRLPGWLARLIAERITLPQSPARHSQPFILPKMVARQVEGDAVAIGAAVMPLQSLFFGQG